MHSDEGHDESYTAPPESGAFGHVGETGSYKPTQADQVHIERLENELHIQADRAERAESFLSDAETRVAHREEHIDVLLAQVRTLEGSLRLVGKMAGRLLGEIEGEVEKGETAALVAQAGGRVVERDPVTA